MINGDDDSVGEGEASENGSKENPEGAKIEDFDSLGHNLKCYELMNDSHKEIVLKNVEINCRRAQYSSERAAR